MLPPKVSSTQFFIMLRYILWVPTRYHIYELIFTMITNLVFLFWFRTCANPFDLSLYYLNNISVLLWSKVGHWCESRLCVHTNVQPLLMKEVRHCANNVLMTGSNIRGIFSSHSMIHTSWRSESSNRSWVVVLWSFSKCCL